MVRRGLGEGGESVGRKLAEAWDRSGIGVRRVGRAGSRLPARGDKEEGDKGRPQADAGGEHEGHSVHEEHGEDLEQLRVGQRQHVHLFTTVSLANRHALRSSRTWARNDNEPELR